MAQILISYMEMIRNNKLDTYTKIYTCIHTYVLNIQHANSKYTHSVYIIYTFTYGFTYGF